MRHFHLTDRELTALAAGRPSPGTLAELRKAQLSRHLLLLSEILRAETPLWYASSPSPQILADPVTGLYAATAVSAMRSGGRPPDRPVLAGPSRTLTATCDDLTLRVRLEDSDPLRDRLGLTPTGRLDAGSVAHWQRMLTEAWQLLVRRHRPSAEVLADVLRVIVPVEPDPAAGGISATSAHAYGAVAMSAPTNPVLLAVSLLHETAHSLLNATTLLFDLVSPSAAALGYSPWRDDPRPPSGVLHGAFAYVAVARFWRTEAALGGSRLAQFEFARWRSAVAGAASSLLTNNPTNHPVDGLSTGAPHDLHFPETIENGGGPRRREGDRHSGGREGDRHNGGREGDRHNGGREAGRAGDEVLTAAGRRFVAALRGEVEPWLGEPVDERVARLARGVNLDHYLRWRLRNLRASEETTASLVAAWRAGAAAPAVAEPDVVAAPRRLESSARLDLVHGWLRNADRGSSGPAADPPDDSRGGLGGAGDGPGDRPGLAGGGVRTGDDAWLGGDYGAGHDAYVLALESVTAPGADLDALLAGLALVSPHRALRERPEIVRAVWLALGRPGLDALLEWLGR